MHSFLLTGRTKKHIKKGFADVVTIKIAGINVGLDFRYPYTGAMMTDFVTSESPDFTVFATDEEIDEEIALIEDAQLTRDMVENIVLYRKIANKITEYDAAVFHGSVIEDNSKAYIFTARSGVGKTTHSRIWLAEFGDDVRILNGDKPILRIIDGVVYACGTPWKGKECYGVNAMRPLAGIALLSRAGENSARALEPEAAVTRFVSQIYLNREDPQALLATIRLADKILSSVPIIEVRCNMDREAARVARAAFREASLELNEK